MTWRVLQGDVRERLGSLEAGSVQTCVTSPPYWGLRDYGHAGQLGLEATPEGYTAAMVEVFRDVRRVLAEDGTLWLNLGDSYAGSSAGGWREGAARADGEVRGDGEVRRNRNGMSLVEGLKPKDLVGIPWMVAFALRADGWYLRSDIIWSKPNPMPESVTDRPTKAHEYIFLLSKSKSYYYDAEAIMDPAETYGRQGSERDDTGQKNASINPRWHRAPLDRYEVPTRNKRSVWSVATQPYPDAHFATFPEALIEPCILAGSREGDTVLDPFTGSGTTGAVSIRHQRSFIGTELNPAYIELARKRIGAVAPLLAQEVA